MRYQVYQKGSSGTVAVGPLHDDKTAADDMAKDIKDSFGERAADTELIVVPVNVP